MQYASQHSPRVLNLDKTLGSLTPTESYYILNHTSLLSINGLKGSNSGKGKPLPANYVACDLEQPAGETYTFGAYRSPLTREIYSWHYNSNGVHYILRTSNSGCQIVYYDDCLDISAEPKHSIENWRAYLAIEKVCANRDGKQLIWVDGRGNINQLDVEASIATNNFTTDFFSRCPYPCAYLRMCVPDPCGCLTAEWVPATDDDLSLNNYMLDNPFQFIYKHVYYDGREGEWSDPSTTYYQSTKGCDSTSNFARCIKFRIPVGNPLVEKVKVGFSNGLDIWYQTEIVDKYKKYNSSQEKWYQRELAELLNYSDVDCSFDYIFCNDKQKIQIDPKEISRVYNPMPRDVQGLINIKEALGFYNYVQGNCPIDKIEIEKLLISANCNESDQNCTQEFSTVTVRALILGEDNAAFVFREGASYNEPDDLTKAALFGNSSHDLSTSYGQKFNDKTRGFIATIEGTDLWSEMKQWEAANGFVNLSEKDVLSIPVGEVSDHSLAIRNQGKYMYSEAKLKVPKGSKGFVQLVSHLSTSGSGSNQNTSTYTIGIGDIRNFVNGNDPAGFIDTNLSQLNFDTCNGDQELFDAFIIMDFTRGGASGNGFAGYITDEDDDPIEGLQVYHLESGTIASVTDHNGFYSFFQVSLFGNNAIVQIRGELDCAAFQNIRQIELPGADAKTTYQDLTITENDFANNFYAKVIAPVKDCDGNPVIGIRVGLKGTNFEVTDADGNATFKVRNYSTRNRAALVTVINGVGCFNKNCLNECNPCMPSVSQDLPDCFVGVPTITLPELIINSSSLVNDVNGLKAGGRYQYAALVQGDCGRISAAYALNFIDIPTTQQKGYLGFCNFSYEDLGMELPSWGKCLKILRSSNLNNYQLQWKVDKIEKTSDGKIKLTIQSLNDYNTQYGFKTNTTYQWVKGDRIEFIYNGDGSILTTASNGILNYLALSPFYDEIIGGETDPPADFFNQLLIEDDGRLDDVTEGAIIEMQRPIAASESPIYHSICVTIPIVNGRLVYPYGTFNTFDTFLINRVINSTGGSFVGTFEHHSPSDFWGERISDAGKRYVANEFENERRYGRNIAINSPTIANFFDTALIKKFDAPEQGDIIAMNIIDGRIIQAICENDNFIAQSADELVRVGGDGIIRALPPDAIISDAEAKPYGAYGCNYDDIGSIIFGDGYTLWYSYSKKCYVRHDYNHARNICENKVATYFRVRGQEKEKHNAAQTDPLNKYRWTTGLNYHTDEVYLTLKTPRLSAIYNEIKPFVKKNDTLIYHPLLDEFLGFASHTPEMYSQFDLDDEGGCSFVSFSNGQPYIHPILSDKFNEFFGVACDEVIGIVINQYPQKQREAQAMEIQSDAMWFSPEIRTENVKFVSEIPAVKWKRSNGKWNANFLFNKNSRSGLFGNSKDSVGETTRGYFIAVTLMKDNTDELKYGTIDNNKRVAYNELDLIFSKFSLIEQTGFDGNL